MDMLPEDLVFHILLWLPVRHLVRFKTVCKAWLYIIESSYFIYRHIDLTNQASKHSDEGNKLLVLNTPSCEYYFITAGFAHVNCHDLQLSSYIQFSPPGDPQMPNYVDILPFFEQGQMLIASYNGIICVNHRRQLTDGNLLDAISLWNPITRQYSFLPSLPVYDEEVLCHRNYSYGFGYDVKNNDHKVVRVTLEYFTSGSTLFKSRAEVYTVGMDSWRVIDVNLPVVFFIGCNPKQPFRDNIYCWLAWDMINKHALIVSFDFHDDIFGIIVPPVMIPKGQLKLGFLSEKIAFIDWVSESPNCYCEIWMLDEYGVEESWNKLYSVTLDQRGYFLGFSSNGMIITVRKDPSVAMLSLVDPVTHESNDLFSLKGNISQVAVYRESLVPFKSASRAHTRFGSQSVLGDPNPDNPLALEAAQSAEHEEEEETTARTRNGFCSVCSVFD